MGKREEKHGGAVVMMSESGAKGKEGIDAERRGRRKALSPVIFAPGAYALPAPL